MSDELPEMDRLWPEELYVYEFTFIDYGGCFLRDPREVFPWSAEREKIVRGVERRLRAAGWEGDGELRVIWIPPFLAPEGSYLWHVKQDNNGISFIASPGELPPAEGLALVLLPEAQESTSWVQAGGVF